MIILTCTALSTTREKEKKYILKNLLLLVFLLNFFNLIQAQNSSTQTIINADSLKNKSVPFDIPFDLITQKVEDIKRVYKVSVLGENGEVDDVLFDTSGKTLVIHLFPIKPKKKFLVTVRSRLSDDNVQLFINLTDQLTKSNYSSAENILSEIRERIVDKSNKIDLYSYSCSTDYLNSEEYSLIKTSITSNINNYHRLRLLDLTQSQNLANIAETDFDNLAIYRLCKLGYLNDISSGVNDINGIISNANTCGQIDLFQRIKNLKSSIETIQELIDSIQVISIQTPNVYAQSILKTLNFNLNILNSNRQILSGCVHEISIILKPHVAEATWITGTSKTFDIDTKTASVLSTDLGVSTILVRDANNQYQTIPRLFVGVNFFFRPVDRNIGSFYAIKRKDINYKKNYLVTRPSIWYHLNLSVALTIGGALNTPGFSNLITNNLSVEVGPSYRFLQAFRISAGIALLNRNNVNPVIENNKLYLGPYASLSVDLAFAKAAKIITDLIYKY